MSARSNWKKRLAAAREERLNEDDLLSAETRLAADALLDEAARNGVPSDGGKDFSERWRRLFPLRKGAVIREWLDLFLVVGAVAFGLRALFFQPFRIPTGSMQPTLYGIHYVDRELSGNHWTRSLPAPLRALLYADKRAEASAPADGTIDPESLKEAPSGLFGSTTFTIGGRPVSLPGPAAKVVDYAGLDPDRRYRAGDKLADGFLSLGDHLFVERFSLYLSTLKRGDVVVFTTENLHYEGHELSEQSGFFYIKRLAGLPGDTLKIVDDQLYVKPQGAAAFEKIQTIAPKFVKVYSDRGGYAGHVNKMGIHLAESGSEYTVPPDHFFMLGDNTRFSLDSRFFGAVPRRNLVGRAAFVFWPFGRRWGIVDTKEPVDLPTGAPLYSTYRSMFAQ